MSTNPHTAEAAALMQSHKDQLAAGTFLLADDAEYFTRATWVDEAVKPLVLIERAIVRHAAQALLAAGFTLNINNGGDYNVLDRDTSDIGVFMANTMQTGEDVIRVYKDGVKVGYIRVIYGNDGWDAMADYSTSLEEVLYDTSEFAEGMGEQLWKEVP